jgi:hypothetical protein
MVHHVRMVGGLLAFHGIFVMLVGLGYCSLGVAMMMALGRRFGVSPQHIGLVLLLIGGLNTTVGILQHSAGLKIRQFRSHRFGLVMLLMNILVLPTLLAFPTGLLLMIYGLIVLSRKDVARTFAMAHHKRMRKEAIDRYSHLIGDVRDDFDDAPRLPPLNEHGAPPSQ